MKIGWALCAQCRVRLEAVLRESRKHGERIGQWGVQGSSEPIKEG